MNVQLHYFTAMLFSAKETQNGLFTVNVFQWRVLFYVSIQINLRHCSVFRMSALGTHACCELCRVRQWTMEASMTHC